MPTLSKLFRCLEEDSFEVDAPTGLRGLDDFGKLKLQHAVGRDVREPDERVQVERISARDQGDRHLRNARLAVAHSDDVRDSASELPDVVEGRQSQPMLAIRAVVEPCPVRFSRWRSKVGGWFVGHAGAACCCVGSFGRLRLAHGQKGQA